MSQSLRRRIDDVQGKPLRMRGETDPKPLRTDDFKRAIGQCIELALSRADLSKKAAAQTMGYGENQATISNWIAGEETPQFAKLWMLGDLFRQELVLAMAANCAGVRVQTVVTLERRRA